MGLYYDSGYLNWDKIINYRRPFNFVIGARGIGKTYGLLKHVIENELKILFIRRLQTQVDSLVVPSLSPFDNLNADLGTDIRFIPSGKNVYTIGEQCEGSKELTSYYGVATGLSTFGNLRGFSGEWVDMIVYDEFIPQDNDTRIKKEGVALYNLYETVARNRELKGKPPVPMYCLSNSNIFASQIIVELNLLSAFEKMLVKGMEELFLDSRGAYILMPRQSPISELKKETALYKFAGDGEYSNMALQNYFKDFDEYGIRPRPIREYRPLVKWGDICIYSHKSNGRFYATTHCSGTFEEYSTTATGTINFRRNFSYLVSAILRDNIDYETYLCKTILTKCFIRYNI